MHLRKARSPPLHLSTLYSTLYSLLSTLYSLLPPLFIIICIMLVISDAVYLYGFTAFFFHFLLILSLLKYRYWCINTNRRWSILEHCPSLIQQAHNDVTLTGIHPCLRSGSQLRDIARIIANHVDKSSNCNRTSTRFIQLHIRPSSVNLSAQSSVNWPRQLLHLRKERQAEDVRYCSQCKQHVGAVWMNSQHFTQAAVRKGEMRHPDRQNSVCEISPSVDGRGELCRTDS